MKVILAGVFFGLCAGFLIETLKGGDRHPKSYYP